MTTLRRLCLRAAQVADPNEKLTATGAIASNEEVGACESFDDVPRGVRATPVLVPASKLTQRSIHTRDGRAALIHALAHIELNAVDLALDIVWRFAGMPDDFYRQWVKVAQEEAYHFTLLRDHLRGMGFEYGDFSAHGALWEMAEKTKGDVLARVALVPRTLETRGLDASPPIKAKLVNAGDIRAGEILDVILRDEIKHVALGNYWFRWLCTERRLEPVATYTELAAQYAAPKPRGPFNLIARREAGFTEEELRALES